MVLTHALLVVIDLQIVRVRRRFVLVFLVLKARVQESHDAAPLGVPQGVRRDGATKVKSCSEQKEVRLDPAM